MKTVLENKEIARPSNSESNRITRECLQIALMKLMEKKSFDKISVTELTRYAGVSRTAFYRNYDSKEAIIEDANQQLFHILSESLNRFKDDHKSWYILFFETVRNRQDAFRTALHAHVGILSEGILDATFPPKNIKEHYTHVAQEAAFVRILTNWFYDGMKESPKKMGELCDAILGPLTL